MTSTFPLGIGWVRCDALGIYTVVFVGPTGAPYASCRVRWCDGMRV